MSLPISKPSGPRSSSRTGAKSHGATAFPITLPVTAYAPVASRSTATAAGRCINVSGASLSSVTHRAGRARSVGVCAALQVAKAAPVKDGGAGKAPAVKVLSETRYDDVGLSMKAEQRPEGYQVHLRLDHARPLTLHWAADDWTLPPRDTWPAGTRQADDKACQTDFAGDGTLRLSLPEAVCPHRLVFVLKEGEVWHNNGGANYGVQLKAPPMESFVEKVLDAEGTYSHWSLPQRLMLATEVLDAAEAAGPAGMAFIFTWLRLSSTRVLDWYRRANFQPKDIAHMQKYCGERMSDKARSSEHVLSRLFARGAMAGLPRGGGNGDEIRMGILHIMRNNGIREGHRPGHDEPFLEQWHQKLHTATSPDDITICEAYLAFLHSGNHDDYWRVLWDNGRLTKEKMQSWDKPISAWPHHLPHLIGPFQHYLWILKTTHSGADLDITMEMAKGHMDDELRWIIFDILGHRNEWWVPGKIVEARQRLAHYWKAPGSSRDLLLLDIALESWSRTLLERTDFNSLSGDDLLELVGLVLRGSMVTLDQDEDLAQCCGLWERLRTSAHGEGRGMPGERWGREWSQAALAASERLTLSVAAHMDELYGLVQPHAEAFGRACKLEQSKVANFGEEVVRGQPLFLVSQLLQRLEPMLRTAAGGAPWQVVSQASGVSGQVVCVSSLAEVQGVSYATPTLLLAAQLTGVEDIPAGVVAVLTRSSTDVLSHLAIRARSQRVLLATCFDDAAWRTWQDHAGAAAAAVIDPAVGAVLPATPSAATGPSATSSHAPTTPRIALQAPERTDAWAVPESAFRPGLVGAKALNLKKLRERLAGVTNGGGGGEIGVPASVALPYGTFERVLADGANAGVAAEVERLVAAAGLAAAAGELPKEALAELRARVSEELVAPPGLVRQLADVAAAQGLIPSADTWVKATAAAGPEAGGGLLGWRAVWSAVCGVWASKWTDRAWLSRRAMGIPEQQLYMSVLLQQVIPVRYAYVLHTSNPVTHTPGELLGEVVVGMGETLVGNYPGRALGFTAPTAGHGGDVKVVSLPSKRIALHAPPTSTPTLIARSDANAEDLEQYAAAGLYDSVTLQPLSARPVDYAQEPLTTDPGFRARLLSGLAGVGRVVQEAFGGRDQDVEGGWLDGKFYVVQARPQVELERPGP